MSDVKYIVADCQCLIHCKHVHRSMYRMTSRYITKRRHVVTHNDVVLKKCVNYCGILQCSRFWWIL